MKTILKIAIYLAAILSIRHLPAQQLVSPGGGFYQATSASLSFSIGEPVIESHFTTVAILPQGFQQGSLSISANQFIDNVALAADSYHCFDALLSLTVQNLVAESGAVVTLVAGASILLLSGTHIKSGAHLYAHISSNGIFCSSEVPVVASELYRETELKEARIQEAINDLFFTIYPNPGTGIFNIEFFDINIQSEITAEIYDMNGKLVHLQVFGKSPAYSINLKNKQPGLYLVRIFSNSITGTKKILIQ